MQTAFAGLKAEDFLELGLSPSGYSSLIEASDRSRVFIQNARNHFANRSILEEDQDLIGFGSLARYELTESSDLDYLLVSRNGDVPVLKSEVLVSLQTEMLDGVELSDPGSTGIFGYGISANDLITNIGLQDDTNINLTRRVLFLEESVSLANPKVHSDAMRQVLETYLHAGRDSTAIPRFLLNDILRYWRTIAVDYQAKAVGNNPKSLRYLKLLIPRKLCFVSSLSPLYFLWLEEDTSYEERLDCLHSEYMQPSVIRVVKLLSHIAAKDPGQKETASRIIQILNDFIGCSGRADWRDAVELEAASGDPKATRSYGGMRAQGKELHKLLGQVFMSPTMTGFTKEFLVL